MKYVLIVILGILITFQAEAKNCKKGQSCGNSCISWNKICRIGSRAVTTSASKQYAELPEQVHSVASIKSSQRINLQEKDDVVYSCDTSWNSIIERFLESRKLDDVVDNAVSNVRLRYYSKGQDFTKERETEVRYSYYKLFQDPSFNKDFILAVRQDPEQVKSGFMPECIKQSKELINASLGSLNR
jgi:hypothetical protein|tara:strand:+ start:21996 stop:22553 length:558 start_codon:yes stop_codon:yes gene_type:complete